MNLWSNGTGFELKALQDDLQRSFPIHTILNLCLPPTVFPRFPAAVTHSACLVSQVQQCTLLYMFMYMLVQSSSFSSSVWMKSYPLVCHQLLPDTVTPANFLDSAFCLVIQVTDKNTKDQLHYQPWSTLLIASCQLGTEPLITALEVWQSS